MLDLIVQGVVQARGDDSVGPHAQIALLASIRVQRPARPSPNGARSVGTPLLVASKHDGTEPAPERQKDAALDAQQARGSDAVEVATQIHGLGHRECQCCSRMRA